MTAAAFEGWAVLELLGHRIRYGRVSEVLAFGEPFCRIDMPTEPPTFELYAGKSIYGMRPASEESIRAYHARSRQLTSGQGEVLIDDDDFDADTGGQHDDEEDEPDLDPPDGMFIRDDEGEDVDDPDDEPVNPRNPAMDPINPELGMQPMAALDEDF